ncbi:hypothetical protein XA68_11542 [Ophiocordyceps unilateralis]|uniref:Uncharacterized protein n=1 Tax=Ophiocordyceps unilateralis TaxID=268505 RepID=A0A2A9PG70_OPHUN|nr:hypothetical protein XA68_11542 [Ophiocordyceps unilateralis]
MGNGEKKWDATAERDLCTALMMSAQEGGRSNANWSKVCIMMESLGHGFTKEAMSQHYSKVILKDFKSRTGHLSLPETPKSTPKKRKAKTVLAADDDDDNDKAAAAARVHDDEKMVVAKDETVEGESPRKMGRLADAAAPRGKKSAAKTVDESAS